MKYPLPAAAVNPAVLIDEHQLKPNPDAEAPQPKATVSPVPPKVTVVPH